MSKDIFEFVKTEEAAFALPIEVVDGWEWNMKEHIRLSTLYKHSQFSQGNDPKNRDEKPFNNIIRPILNLQYRTEGFDVKDVILYIDDSEKYYKSFFVKKYHDRWAQENQIDTFIDDTNESIVDYGGALVRDVNQKRPELIPLPSIAFCDQTNMLSGPIGIKHFYSPDQLQDFEKLGWGKNENGADVTIEEAIILAKTYQVPDAQNGKENRTPGKYVECYEVNGMLPESWLKKGGSPDKYVLQMQILLYYFDKDGHKKGLTLFKGRAPKGTFKVAMRDKIHSRALGFGGVEELFDAQVWTNYGEIAMKGMLDVATKVILETTDTTLKSKHPGGLKNLDNLEIVEVEDGKTVGQINTTPVNIALFERSVNTWEQKARTIGAANDAILGENPTSGEPFKTTNLINAESHGLHDYRQGKYATFIGNVYYDWVIPHISNDLSKGKKFLEELSMKELQYVADALVECETEKVVTEKILNGQEIVPADIENVKKGIRAQFMKKGNKHFLEIFEGEMKDAPLQVKVSVDGKQKDLAKVTDKVVNIVRQVIAAPQILAIPGMADLFNQIIEYSGLSPVDFSTVIHPQPVQPVQPGQGQAPVVAPAQAPAY